MKIDAAFCWEGHDRSCDCCNYPKESVAFIEFYPDHNDAALCFYLCEDNATRVAALERRVAPEEATSR